MHSWVDRCRARSCNVSMDGLRVREVINNLNADGFD